MNPSYIRGVIPNDSRKHILRIPTDRKKRFDSLRYEILSEVSAASLPILADISKQLKKRTYGKKRIYYKVRRGDALSTIAQKYGVRVSEIKRWNQLRSNRIYAGKRLRIWAPKRHRSTQTNVSSKRRTPTRNTKNNYHIVERGDTLWSIAHERALSVHKIKQLNNLHTSRIIPGQRLVLSK